MTDFVHLHLHTEYSLLDGAVRLSMKEVNPDNPEKPNERNPLAERLKELGMTACAITDHGNMYGAHAFVSTLRKFKINPIIGQEFYIADNMYAKTSDVLKQRYHLVLLAKNGTGYKNLMKLSSLAFVDGFYMKPRIDLKRIAQYSEGLICLSACLAGKIPQLLLQNDYEGAKNYAVEMRDMFEKGDFYIELQDHGLPEDKIVLNQLVRLAKEIGVKVVATNDVHYIHREDADVQDTMMCITLQCKKNEMNNARFDNDEFYLKSGDEMAELFSWCPEAISNTLEVAAKIEKQELIEEKFIEDGVEKKKITEKGYFVVESKTNLIPKYFNDDMGDKTAKEYLHDLAYDNIKSRYAEITPAITERLDYELRVIDESGFDDYFLIVWDYVHEAQKRGIPVGPGRGSGVGSIVAYSIGITDVDPLRYNLLFERFLNKERVSMPDFDVDFCFVRRQEVVDYCVEKYTKPNVSQIIAYSTMSAKAVVKDVARVLDVPYNDANLWVKEIPTGKVHLKELFLPASKQYSADFVKLYENNLTAKKVIDTAIELEGMPRQTSMHAAGVVICGEPIVNYVALSRNGQDITTQFDKVVIEKLGLLKMDFLGLKTLTDISEAIRYIKEDGKGEIDFHKIGYEDSKVYELISSGDCEAVFQLEGGGIKKFMSQLQPSSLDDVMAGISLYRPGPMQFLDDFICGKKNPDKITYLHPMLESILKTTYGCIVYQEQVMQIAQKVAGYSYGGADMMRRIMSKKKADELNAQRDIFIHGGIINGDKTQRYNCGAVANGMTEEIASTLFEQIKKFAEYAFNKSHAAAYAYLSYQTAYLKCYFPTHYLMAVVNNRISNADETKHYMNYMKRVGIKILPPDINKSKKLFSISGKDIRYGLMGIKNVGEQAMESVLNERENGQFENIRDFMERCAGFVNKRMIECLIKGGAFDSFNKTRATLMASYERIMDTVLNDKKNKANGQISMFDFLEIEEEIKYNEVDEYDKHQKLSFEKEVLGMYVSGHPLDDSRDEPDFDFDTSLIFTEVTDEDGETSIKVDNAFAERRVTFGCIIAAAEKKTTKQMKKFAVGSLEDRMGSIAFTMFPYAYERYGDYLSTEMPVKVSGKVDLKDESEPKVIIEKIVPWIDGSKISSGNAGAEKTESLSDNLNGVLYILIKSKGEYSLVSSVIQLHRGAVPCRAQITENGKSGLKEFSTKVDASYELIDKLKKIVGDDNVKYVLK